MAVDPVIGAAAAFVSFALLPSVTPRRAPCIPPGPPPYASLIQPTLKTVPVQGQSFIVRIEDRSSVGSLQLSPVGAGIVVSAPLVLRAGDQSAGARAYGAYVPLLTPHVHYVAAIDIIQYPGPCQKFFTIHLGSFLTQ